MLESLPSCFVLPIGGSGYSSLTMFSAFCAAIRAARKDQHSTTIGQGCMLGVLPDILNDTASCAALLGVWARRYYAQMTDFMAYYNGRPQNLGKKATRTERVEHRRYLLDTLVPVLDEMVADLWVVVKCQERMTFVASQYEREYMGSYSTIREASRESADAFEQRVNRLVSEFQRKILNRAINRREEGVEGPDMHYGQFYDECVLSDEHKQLLKDQDAGKLKIDEWDKLKRYATSDDGAYTYQAHAPFNTRELLGAAAPGPDWEYHRY